MKAVDVMTNPVITIDPDSTVADAAKRMLEHRISGLPVCDPAGRLLGVISEGDLLRRAEAGTQRRHSWWLSMLAGSAGQAADYVKQHSRRVRDVMSTSVITVEENTPLDAVVGLMETNRIKRVPVVREGKLAGIISRANLLHVLASVASDVADAIPDDRTLRDRVLGELRDQPWAPDAGKNVVVRNGVVHLWGSVRSQTQRDAMRVAAENVPGVRNVEDHLTVVDAVAEGAAGL
ncbi:CBS domain-containing protein [Azospirillum sp. sgz301742]